MKVRNGRVFMREGGKARMNGKEARGGPGRGKKKKSCPGKKKSGTRTILKQCGGKRKKQTFMKMEKKRNPQCGEGNGPTMMGKRRGEPAKYEDR